MSIDAINWYHSQVRKKTANRLFARTNRLPDQAKGFQANGISGEMTGYQKGDTYKPLSISGLRLLISFQSLDII